MQHSTTELDLLSSKRVRFRNGVFIREQCRFSSVHSGLLRWIYCATSKCQPGAVRGPCGIALCGAVRGQRFCCPPFAAFRKIFQGFPFSADMYAICFPSGDQRGSAGTDTGRRCACSSFLSDRRPILAVQSRKSVNTTASFERDGVPGKEEPSSVDQRTSKRPLAAWRETGSLTSGRIVGNPYLGITSCLLVIHPEDSIVKNGLLMARLSQPKRYGNCHGLMARRFICGAVRFWTRGVTSEHSVLWLKR